jgi:hypothetical protein
MHYWYDKNLLFCLVIDAMPYATIFVQRRLYRKFRIVQGRDNFDSRVVDLTWALNSADPRTNLHSLTRLPLVAVIQIHVT